MDYPVLAFYRRLRGISQPTNVEIQVTLLSKARTWTTPYSKSGELWAPCLRCRAWSAISLGGTVDGTRLLSPKTIDLISQEQTNGLDLVMMGKFRFALPGKDTTAVDWLLGGRICTWGGMGGSLVTMDVDKRLTISYVMTKMQPTGLGGGCTRAYIHAVYNALESS